MAKAEIKTVYCEYETNDLDLAIDEYKMYEPEIVFGGYPRDLIYFVANDKESDVKVDVAIDWDIAETLNGLKLKMNDYDVYLHIHKITRLKMTKAYNNEYTNWCLSTDINFESENDVNLLDLLNKFDEFVSRFEDFINPNFYVLK